MKYPLSFVVSHDQPVTEQEIFKTTSVIKVVTIKNTDNFITTESHQ